MDSIVIQSLLFLPLILSLNQAEVCFPSVVRHRIDSILPTSRLFCVSKQNDVFVYDDLKIVQNDEQWLQYSKSRWKNEATEGKDDPKLLLFGNVSSVRLFKLPAAVSETDFCTGTQNVEIGRNLTVRCKPLATADLLSQCTENEFLSALEIFGNGEFLARDGNDTIGEVTRKSPQQLRTPVWNGSSCIGVMKAATVRFEVNGTAAISGMEIDVEYDILPGNVDNNWFEQTFSVEFVDWRAPKTASEVENQMNRTAPEIGYQAGNQVFRAENSVPVPFAVPTLGQCYSGAVPPSAVVFLRPMSSICTIPTSSCEDARAKARSFYEQVYPSELFSSPAEESSTARVGRLNVTWEQISPSTSSCRLPVSSLLQIYHSKQGSTTNFREVIVAGNVQLLLDDLDYLPGQEIRMPISVSFTDVTPPPKSIFASLPYVDIRLPHDFFYPFISSFSSFQFSIFSVVLYVSIV